MAVSRSLMWRSFKKEWFPGTTTLVLTFLELWLILQCIIITHGFKSDVGLWFKQSPNTTIGKPGSKVVLYCEPNLPAERIRWKFNGQFINLANESVDSNITNINFAYYLMPNSGNLVVNIGQDVKYFGKQTGYYQCVVWFGSVALTSIPALLSVAQIDPYPSRQNVTIPVVAGNSIVAECVAPFSVPAAMVGFYKNGKPVDTNKPNIHVINSGNLHICSVMESDDGIYTCDASNVVTNESVYSGHVTRLAMSELKDRKTPHFLLRPRDSYSITAGSNITLECVAVGNPPPIVTWRKSRGNLPPNRTKQICGNLYLTNVSPMDVGVYVCEAVNGMGTTISAVTKVELQVMPSISIAPFSQEVEEGGQVTLHCKVNGNPKPSIQWIFNGNLVQIDGNIVLTSERLWIQVVEKKHAGLYQCFAMNILGTVFETAMLHVVPKQITAESDAMYPSRTPLSGALTTASTINSKHWDVDLPKGRRQNNRRKGKRRKNKGNAVMIPPSKPNITKLSDESVMVRWDVPVNDGLKITFFKVQYKEMNKDEADWITIDEDIPHHIRSYEVPGLTTGQTYRFRVAAVYSNHDNKLGPNSIRFTLQKDPAMKRPPNAPAINHAEAVSSTTIFIRWEYIHDQFIPVEGFFIYYRSSTSAADYTKVTVLGANVNTHLISHLLPDAWYEVKMQCFNMAGTSDFSRIISQRTIGTSTPKVDETELHGNEVEIVTSDDLPSNEQLYTVLGGVLGGLVLLILFMLAIYNCRQRSNRQASEQSSKFPDGSTDSTFEQTIFSLNPPCAVNGHICNGYLSLQKSPYPLNSQNNIEGDKNQNIVETSFVEPNTLDVPDSCCVVRNGGNHIASLDSDDSSSDSDEPSSSVIRQSLRQQRYIPCDMEDTNNFLRDDVLLHMPYISHNKEIAI